MRIQAPDEDDLLEPLPVYVDGVAVAPGYGRRGAHAVAESPDDVFDDARPAAIAQVPEVPRLPAGSGSPYRGVPAVQRASFTGAFRRMIALRAGTLDSLPDWWRQRADDERVEIARRLFLAEPQRFRAGTWRMRGALRSTGRARAIPIDLLLWPHLEAWTKLALEPQRGVSLGRRYFTNGHRVLDALCTELIQELTPNASGRDVAAGVYDAGTATCEVV
jgi:hypothetical protein